MPVNEKPSAVPLYQRAQYAKGGVGRAYWDYRDRVALSFLDKGDRRIVDVGCGEGITLERVAKRFPSSEIAGLDYMSENVEICRAHGLPAARGDVYNLEISSGSADAVLLFEVIEHLDRPEAALLEIARILKGGGKFVMIFPNDFMFKLARLATGKFKEAAYDPGHVRQWTPRDARAALDRAGFVVRRVRAIPFLLWPLSLHCIVYAEKRVTHATTPSANAAGRGAP